MADDLTKALGADRGNKEAWLAHTWLGRLWRRLPLAPLLGALLAFVVLVPAVYVASVDDPLGGEPHALAPIVAREPPPQVSDSRTASGIHGVPGGAPGRPSVSALEVENASGVSVVRPDGTGAPQSIVIQIPDALPRAAQGALAAAPDQRLVERTRHGLLPQVGRDGTQASALYARDADTLPGGATPLARVAILVGGLGIGQAATNQAITRLPPAVTLAFAPYGADLERLVSRARAEGHEIMLQLPMEPFDYPDNDPGPHTLRVDADPAENLDRLHWVMGRFTGYVGVVNFMGARLTADEKALAPLLREIAGRGLGFVDDGSSSRSLVPTMSASAKLAAARADIVLDANPRAEPIDRELQRLEALALERGFALGTASALPLTIERLARWAEEAQGRGILLVPVSYAFRNGSPG